MSLELVYGGLTLKIEGHARIEITNSTAGVTELIPEIGPQESEEEPVPAPVAEIPDELPIQESPGPARFSSSVAKAYGAQLLALRERHGLSRAMVGARLGVSGTRVGQLERKGIPDLPYLTKIAQVFGLSADNFLNYFSSWIQENRRAKGWTQQQVADYIGTSRSLVSLWETGRKLPTTEQEMRLREIL